MIFKIALTLIFLIVTQLELHAVEKTVPIPEEMYRYFSANILERKKNSLLIGFRHVSPKNSIKDKEFGSKIEIILFGDGKILGKTVRILHSVVDEDAMRSSDSPQSHGFDVVNTYIFLQSEDLVEAKKMVISESSLSSEIILNN